MTSLIEPGGFRTDWAGSSMKIVQPGDPYKETVGILLSMINAAGMHATGDPKKAANVILKVADMEEPPMWLPLGSDAVAMIRQADESKLAEIAKWEELSLTTDADDAVQLDLSKL